MAWEWRFGTTDPAVHCPQEEDQAPRVAERLAAVARREVRASSPAIRRRGAHSMSRQRPGSHVHGNAGVDTRAKPIGKLAVDVGVNQGGYSQWLGKRGYHVFGAACGSCPAPNLAAGRDVVGNFGSTEFKTTSDQVKAGLAAFSDSSPKKTGAIS